MKKNFVLDTNVLLHNADSISSFSDNNVILPMGVIEELDRFKKNHDEMGRNARRVIRHLDNLRARGSLGEGVKLENGGSLRIIFASDSDSKISLNMNVVDNQILRIAHDLHKKGDSVIFVSKDINARLKADALGIEAQDFEKQKVNFDELFQGYREELVSENSLNKFYQNHEIVIKDLDAYPNEFIVLVDEKDIKHSALCRYTEEGKLVGLCPQFEIAWTVKSRSREQRMALELLMDDRIQVVTLVGQAGTGKTLLALAAGLELTLKQKKYEKILVSRPIMPLGRDIGYLPGDKEEKLKNWMEPIFDNLTYLMSHCSDKKNTIRERVDKLLKDNVIEMEAMTYVRGRSIPQQYIIVDEAQNLTPHEIKTIVSRAGEGAKMVITGDPYQIDNPYLDSSSNGLTYAVERLKTQAIHGHVTLIKSERSKLAAIAAELL